MRAIRLMNAGDIEERLLGARSGQPLEQPGVNPVLKSTNILASIQESYRC